MKQLIKWKWFLCINIVVLIVLCLVDGIWISHMKQSMYVQSYVAKHDILPDTKIEEKDLESVHVPSSYLNRNIWMEKEDIVGKYTTYRTTIPAGSPFYRSVLQEEQSKESGKAVFVLKVDQYVSAGDHINLYCKIDNKEGEIIHHALVICVRDHQCVSIDQEDSIGMPYSFEILVDEKDIPILKQVENSLYYVVAKSEQDIEEGYLLEDSEIVQYIGKQKEKE